MSSSMSISETERLERETRLRMKFAALSPRGDPVSDAHDEYANFFDGLPDGWTAQPIGNIETRHESIRPAWELSDGRVRLVAVEHETGIEVLLFGMLTNFLSGAVTAMAVWSWRKWADLRRNNKHKAEVSFVVEVARSDEPGSPPVRIILPPPVTDAEMDRFLRWACELGAHSSAK